MAKKLQDKAQDNIQAVEEALSRTEMFLEKHQKPILIGLGVIILIFGGYFGYQRFIKLPKTREAQEKMYVAERYFAQDSLNLALNGDGLNLGFLDIIDDYGRTPGGNLARYYAGAIYLKQGNFAEAITLLKKFKSKDPMVYPNALRMLGDANLELNNQQEAIEYYLKAAEKANNDLLTPEFLMRAGNTYELMKEYQKALDIYNRIKTEYPTSFRSSNIEKYIARVEMYLAHGTGK
ncbi:MAG TPA: tetratricopeptide repeat protein [Bacteroidales bacterium]|nr:tetratricopeptide repeat protein [Bacteroidales bacterium]HRZ50155.1 tetratricopeptide repeat protein [Bacteroidales bacterium]